MGSEHTKTTESTRTKLAGIKRAINAISNWFSQHPWAKTVLTVLLIVIPIFFLSRSLFDNWQTLKAADVEINWGRMTISLVILMAAFALFPSGTLIGLRGLGVKLTYPQVYYGYHASQLGKYLPGRIWIIPGRAVTLHRYGVDGLFAGTSAIIDTYVLIVAGILVYVPGLFTSGQETMHQLGYLGLLLCLPLVASVFFPQILNKLFSLMMKLIGRGEVTIHFAWYHFALMLVNYMMLWVLSGIGLFLLGDSFSPLALGKLPQVIGAMGFSWVIGTLSFLTPAGLGVREGAMGILLTGLLPVPFPALVAILARFWWSLADFASIGLAFVFLGKKRRNTPSQ
jgi:uncharacterized membrane protein YbhN (UPF0104 family)